MILGRIPWPCKIVQRLTMILARMLRLTMFLTSVPWLRTLGSHLCCRSFPANKTVCDTLNRSYTQFHHNKYGGIPQAFVLNVIGAAFLIMVFSVLRRRAGDYARLALNHETWKGLFQEDQVRVFTIDSVFFCFPPRPKFKKASVNILKFI